MVQGLPLGYSVPLTEQQQKKNRQILFLIVLDNILHSSAPSDADARVKLLRTT